MFFRKEEVKYIQELFKTGSINYESEEYFFVITKLYGISTLNFTKNYTTKDKLLNISTANGKMYIYSKVNDVRLSLREQINLVELLMQPFDILNIPHEELTLYDFNEAGSLYIKNKRITLNSLEAASYIYSLADNLKLHENYKAVAKDFSKSLKSLLNKEGRYEV